MAILDDVELFSVKGDGSIKINFGDLHRRCRHGRHSTKCRQKHCFAGLETADPAGDGFFRRVPANWREASGGSGVHFPFPTLGTDAMTVSKLLKWHHGVSRIQAKLNSG